MEAAPDGLPVGIRDYRERYRVERVPRHYSGRLHLASTSLTSLVGVALAINQIHAPSLLEWGTVPAAFLVANLAEYLGHRFPMHHRYPGLAAVFRRHAGTHHRFFVADAMAGRDARDWHVTLFPPILILFFFGVIGAPLAGLLLWLAPPNVAWLFVATAITYFLTYEWLHLSYHIASGSLLGRLPGVASLARHHQRHHDPLLMGRCNFNITFPIVDRVVGTSAPDRQLTRSPGA